MNKKIYITLLTFIFVSNIGFVSASGAPEDQIPQKTRLDATQPYAASPDNSLRYPSPQTNIHYGIPVSHFFVPQAANATQRQPSMTETNAPSMDVACGKKDIFSWDQLLRFINDKKENDKLQRTVDSLSRELESSNRIIIDKDALIDGLSRENTQQATELESLRAQLAQERQKNQAAEHDIKRLESSLGFSRQQLETQDKANRALREQLATQRQLRFTAEEKRRTLENSLVDTQQQLRTQDNANSTLMQQVADLKRTEQNLLRDLSDARADAIQLTEDLQAAQRGAVVAEQAAARQLSARYTSDVMCAPKVMCHWP